jgi:transposase
MSQGDESLVHAVVNLNRDGMSRRAIARALKISRNTVRGILAKHSDVRQQPHSALPVRSSIKRPSKLDPFRPQIDELFRVYPDITAQRVFECIGQKGYDGGYSIVKDLVRVLRPKPPPRPSLETPPREPADMAECDWSPYQVTFTHAPAATLQAFGYTLRYSTRKFYSFHESNGLHPLMDGHVHAFERFEGSAKHCKYDCQKPVVLRWEGRQAIYNPRFIDFATYYEFSPVACRPRHPNDKPRVERSFYEMTLSFFRGRSFRDMADLKAQLTHWMDTVADPRPLKRMRHRTRLDLFSEEQPLLRPLPRHPYDTARVLYKICDIEGYVAWDGNWYSLPYDFVTEILPIRVTEDELFIYRPDLKCIARHPLLPRGAQRRSIIDGHRPRNAEHGPGLDQLRQAFADIGEVAVEFLDALEQRQRRSAGYHARKILSLREAYHTSDLLAALAHANAYAAVEHSAVERILLAQARPRRLDEYVAEQTARKLQHAVAQSTTEPRDLAEYDALPCRGAVSETRGEVPCPEERREDQPQTSVSGSNNISNDSD